jgi:hypothetical protein
MPISDHPRTVSYGLMPVISGNVESAVVCNPLGQYLRLSDALLPDIQGRRGAIAKMPRV